MSRREDLHLADIVTAHYRIASYLEGLDFSGFQKDDLRQDGVIRQLSIIGEAASSLTQETRDSQPEIPWKLVRGMRNMLVHQYFDADLIIVFNAATKSVPELAARILALLAQRDPTEAARVLAHKPSWLD
ncbi:HepT-like ribonuclease domain-containing protein [Nocardia sp. NPDC050413]|uniref:HepT-like ribonuclease domain-containing protein n=1 Tax=Nocardia sp. NPDC050413 TaxID=3155784 RepID=UPI00340AFB13